MWSYLFGVFISVNSKASIENFDCSLQHVQSRICICKLCICCFSISHQWSYLLFQKDLPNGTLSQFIYFIELICATTIASKHCVYFPPRYDLTFQMSSSLCSQNSNFSWLEGSTLFVEALVIWKILFSMILGSPPIFSPISC